MLCTDNFGPPPDGNLLIKFRRWLEGGSGSAHPGSRPHLCLTTHQKLRALQELWVNQR
jgi:hypothetical protein